MTFITCVSTSPPIVFRRMCFLDIPPITLRRPCYIPATIDDVDVAKIQMPHSQQGNQASKVKKQET